LQGTVADIVMAFSVTIVIYLLVIELPQKVVTLRRKHSGI